MTTARVYTIPTLYGDVLKQAHTLVAGQTGSGKSVFLNGVLTTACKKGDIAFILIDPKRVELVDYKHLPNTLRYANTPTEAVNCLDYALGIMEARYIEMEKQGEKQSKECSVIVVIDELADLLISSESKTIQKQLQRLTALGRASNVHCIVATQCPNRKILPANITLNFSARVALHCQTAIESRQVINEKGAEDLPMYGECLYLRPSHKVEKFNVPMTSEEDKADAIASCKEANSDLTPNLIRAIFRA